MKAFHQFYLPLFVTAIFAVSTNHLFAQNTNYGTGSGTLGSYNSTFGYYTGNSLSSTSQFNSFFGAYSGYSNTSGSYNTSIGEEALFYGTTGDFNTALGFGAMYTNTTGASNTALGYKALYSNVSGQYNISTGGGSMYFNTSGSYNSAHGYQALSSNTTGYNNSAFGYGAMFKNTTGVSNVAVGSNSLHEASTGGQNTAIGDVSLWSNTASWNTGIGQSAMYYNTTGEKNTSLGTQSLYWNTTGSNNTAIGFDAGPSSSYPNLSNSLALGYQARVTASNQVRIGNSSVTSIGGYAAWSNLSDFRFKQDIREDVSGLDFIEALRPISYSINLSALNRFLGLSDDGQAETNTLRHTGFIAQDVENLIQTKGFVFYGVNTPQNDRDHYSISYAEFVVPLVKAVQDLSLKVKEHQKTIDILMYQLNSSLANPVSKAKGSDRMVLMQNMPNPFNSDTSIEVMLPESVAQAFISIYDLAGRELTSIPINDRGRSRVNVSGYLLSPGIFLYALVVDGELIDAKRMIITK